MRICRFVILILLLPGLEFLYSQEVESSFVEIHLNNLPDTVAPAIRILSPVSRGDRSFQTVKEEFNIIGEITDESEIKLVSVNSQLIQVNELGVFTTRIRLIPGRNHVRVVAADVNDNLREDSLIVEYTPPVLTLADKIKKESRYCGLIIGIDNYDDSSLPDLDNPVRDAEKLFNLLTTRYTFRKEDMILLRDARRNDIVHALDMLARRVTPNDNVLIFYAGHGTWDEKANIGYWLPSDAFLNSTINWFRNSTLVDYLKVIDSKHTLLITDACFAGSIFKTRSAFPKEEKAYEVLYELPSRKAMTSGTLTEVPDRSSFTRYLLDRLNENEEMYLSSEQLFSSFRIAVINNSDAIPQYGEIRNVGDEGGDFIFLRKK